VNRSGIILLVDDSADDVDLTLRAFEREKVVKEIVVANDGEAALEYLFGTGSHAKRDLSVMPEVVLLDLNMPKMDGLSVLRRIRAHAPTRLLPVVVLTSSTQERDLIASYDLGANSFVKKPVDFAQFLVAARQLGLYWLALNEAAPAH